MAQAVRDIMTPDPITVSASDTLADAARAMREADIGPVVVLERGKICGVVTDRDIVVRAIADGKDPKKVKVGDICTRDLTTIRPDEDADEAVKLMRERAIRRVPVVEEDKPVGMLSIGDLAQEKDPKSALADISAAPPNN